MRSRRARPMRRIDTRQCPPSLKAETGPYRERRGSKGEADTRQRTCAGRRLGRHNPTSHLTIASICSRGCPRLAVMRFRPVDARPSCRSRHECIAVRGRFPSRCDVRELAGLATMDAGVGLISSRARLVIASLERDHPQCMQCIAKRPAISNQDAYRINGSMRADIDHKCIRARDPSSSAADAINSTARDVPGIERIPPTANASWSISAA